ncbi:hypothetical protein EB077_14205, partial [bacterium]|nr:hypothetical protein [bacterium]
YINLNYNDNSNSLTVSVTGLQPSGNYSVVGHTHVSSNITDFNPSVSGLLPSVSGSGYASTSFSNNVYTISVTGLQPSGNYANAIHSHVVNDITNFASGVSGVVDNFLNTLLVAGTGIILTFDDNTDSLTVSVTGLQPSGNYSVVGHNHNTSNITDFNSSVSGLLPIKNIIAGSGIGIVSSSGNFTVSVTGSFGLTGEEVDDKVNSLLVAGTGIFLNYNDNNNILTISTSGGYEEILEYNLPLNFPASGDINSLYIATDLSRLYQWTGNEYVELGPAQSYLQNHTHVSSDINDFNSAVSGLLPVKNIISGNGIDIINNSGNYTVSVTGSFGLTSEEVDDRVNSLLVPGTYINLNYNDNSNSLTVSVTGLQPSGNYSVVGHTH